MGFNVGHSPYKLWEFHQQNYKFLAEGIIVQRILQILCTQWYPNLNRVNDEGAPGNSRRMTGREWVWYCKACEGMVWFGREPVGFPPQGAESSNHKTIAAIPPSSSSWQPSSNTQKCWNILQIYFSCIFCKYYASLFCQSILLVFCHNLFPRSYILYKFIYKPRPKT